MILSSFHFGFFRPSLSLFVVKRRVRERPSFLFSFLNFFIVTCIGNNTDTPYPLSLCLSFLFITQSIIILSLFPHFLGLSSNVVSTPRPTSFFSDFSHHLNPRKCFGGPIPSYLWHYIIDSSLESLVPSFCSNDPTSSYFWLHHSISLTHTAYNSHSPLKMFFTTAPRTIYFI